MRIIAGEFRGRTLRAPKGEGTRPTTDRVREALMSALASARGGFEGAVVLDAFAGSGALGLEALSRGAEQAQFCERGGAALRALSANVASLGLPESRARIQRTDVLAHPPTHARPPFDVVLLDPPYATSPTEVIALIAALDAGGALAADTLISYEHAATDAAAVEAALATAQAPLVFYARKTYGATGIDFFRKEAP